MPLYSDVVLDEIRNSVNIVSLVSEYVALKKRGRNYVARCPFHTEKTPSFNVNPEKQIFMCFGCGVGGDAFKFVMQVEHIGFPEAVQFLAEKHGITLPQTAQTEYGENKGHLEVLGKAMVAASEYFHRMLLESEEGSGARRYLQSRGIPPQTIETFRLGFAPAGGDALLRHMEKSGFSAQTLEECGLVKQSDDGRRHYDAFRGRIMFPITDVRGRVIAFGGRALGDAQPKYLNSPETRLYNKSRNLFGLSYSREGIKKQDCAILVEGYMDFLIPFQSGIDNVVASLGTSLTPQQVKLLGRYTREVIVSYDPDSAGLSATQRSLDLFLEEDFRVKVVRLPDGQDPDAFVRVAGAEEYRARLRQAASYLDFVFENALRTQGTLDDPRKKVQVINEVLPYLAKLPNAVERSDYVFRFARSLQVDDALLLAEMKKAAQQRNARIQEAPLNPAGTMKPAEKRLLQILLENASLQNDILPLCSIQDFEGLVTQKVFRTMLEKFRSGANCTYEDLRREFAGQTEQNLLVQMQMEEFPETRSCDTAESFLNALRMLRLDSYKRQIQAKIAEASGRQDQEMLVRLMEQRIKLDRERVSLSRK